MLDHEVEGYDHAIKASSVIKSAVVDLFARPKAAQDRAIAERELLGEENHGDDLLCGCWAAPVSATALLELAGRHIDAVVQLADVHPAFAPSSAVLARGSSPVGWCTSDPSSGVRR